MVAVDIVGELPLTLRRNKYLLTAMCLFSKYAEAVPLKRVDNISVAEGLTEIFSRHGLPNVLLTDQGTVFTSKLTQKLWRC